MLTSQTPVVSIDLCSAVVLHYYWSQTVKMPSSSCFIVLNRVLLLTQCCFTVWSSGWSTAGRSTVNYASTDLLLHQVSSRGLDGSSIWIYHTAQSVLNKPPRWGHVVLFVSTCTYQWNVLVHSVPVCSSSVYSPDMPSRLPIQDICAGLLTSVGTAIRYWFHYTLVAFAWLGVVPLTACK